MGFLFTIVFLVLIYLSPASLVPALAPLRPVLMLSALTGMATFAGFLGRQFDFRALQLYLMAGFFGAVILSRLGRLWLGGALEAALEFAPIMLCFAFVFVNCHTVRRLRILGYVFPVVAVMVTLQGLFAVYFHYRYEEFVFVQTVWDGWTPVGHIERIRGAGYLADPNDAGLILVTALPFLVQRWGRNPLSNVGTVIAPGILILIGLYHTNSRGAMLALLVMVCAHFYFKLGKGMAITVGIVGLALVVAVGFGTGRDVSLDEGSARGRIEAWSDGLQMLKMSPIWGVGYNLFTDYHERAAHNSFVQCFAELGFVGLFFWIACIYVTVKELNAMTRLPQNSEENVEIVRTARILRLAFVAYLAAAWFLSRAYEPTFYVLNGMTAALAGVLRARSVASPAVAPAKVTRPASGLAAAANPGARPQLPVFGLGLAFRVAVIEIAIVCSIYVLMHIRSLQ